MKDLFYLNKNIKKIITFANPVICKFEMDIVLKKTNVQFSSFNYKNITLVINTIIIYLSSIHWRNNMLVDMLCVDLLKILSKYDFNNNSRFKLKYTFQNLHNQDSLNFYIPIYDKFAFYSLEKLIPSTIWLQREVWDMFGIIFRGSTDLRRILTDYGFKSFPLRTDFPVFGNLEIYYDIEMSELLYKKIDAVQENRFFSYNKSLFWY